MQTWERFAVQPGLRLKKSSRRGKSSKHYKCLKIGLERKPSLCRNPRGNCQSPYKTVSRPGISSAQPLQLPSTPGLFPAGNTYTKEYTAYIQYLSDSPAWSTSASALPPATTPLHRALGQAIPSSLGSTCSLQKHLSPSAFFPPLQKPAVLQTWQSVRLWSALKSFWLKTGLPPRWWCKARLPKMCMYITEKYCPPEIGSHFIKYKRLWTIKTLYETTLACKNRVCFKWMTSPCHSSTNKRLWLSAQMLLLCLARQTSRQKLAFLCTTSFCSYYLTTKTESLHPIQTIRAKLIQHLWEKSHNEHLIDPRRCERVQSNSKRLETKQVHFP